jgi:hypothetical protein
MATIEEQKAAITQLRERGLISPYGNREISRNGSGKGYTPGILATYLDLPDADMSNVTPEIAKQHAKNVWDVREAGGSNGVMGQFGTEYMLRNPEYNVAAPDVLTSTKGFTSGDPKQLLGIVDSLQHQNENQGYVNKPTMGLFKNNATHDSASKPAVAGHENSHIAQQIIEKEFGIKAANHEQVSAIGDLQGAFGGQGVLHDDIMNSDTYRHIYLGKNQISNVLTGTPMPRGTKEEIAAADLWDEVLKEKSVFDGHAATLLRTWYGRDANNNERNRNVTGPNAGGFAKSNRPAEHDAPSNVIDGKYIGPTYVSPEIQQAINAEDIRR